MAIFFLFLFLAAIAFRLYRLKRKESAAPLPIKEFNIHNFDHLKKILNDTSKWNRYSSTYDEEIVKKRRKKFISDYNEMITKQSLQEFALIEWTKFASKVQNISNNPAKVFRNIIIPLMFGLGSLSGLAQSAKNYIEEGNNNYKSKNYSEALNNYNSALEFPLKPEKLAGLHYKIAITFSKLKNCDSAKGHYSSALQSDPQNGGATSMDKFESKLRECHFSKSDLDLNASNNASNNVPPISQPDPNNEAVKTEQAQTKSSNMNIFLFLFIGMPFILLASWIIAKIIASIFFKVSSKQKRMDLDAFVHDDLFWNGLAGKGYKSDKLEEVKNVFSNASQSLTTSSSDSVVSDVYRHIYWIKNDPGLYLSDNSLTEGNLRYLLKTSELDFYCFFTSEHLPISKTNAYIIKHPNNSSLDKRVWVSNRVHRMIEKKAKIKVRLHPVNGSYTHWSNDKTYFDKFTPQVPISNVIGNIQAMEKWSGEAKEIDLNKYYEVFTSPFPNYIFPHPETILQGFIDYQGNVPVEKTGFDDPNVNYQQGDNYTSSGLDPLLTGAVIGSMLSDHDRDRYDNSGNRNSLSDVS